MFVVKLKLLAIQRSISQVVLIVVHVGRRVVTVCARMWVIILDDGLLAFDYALSIAVDGISLMC
jgi:hypothetical protein